MNYIYDEHENVYASMRKWQHDSTEKLQKQLLYLYLGLAFLTLLSKTYVKLKYLMLLLNLSPFIWQGYQKILLGYWSDPKVKKNSISRRPALIPIPFLHF